MSTWRGEHLQGVSFISLSSGSTEWRAILDKIIDVRPTVAGSTVAAIGDGFHTIYGLSKATGDVLWQKETGSRILESDGKYFYVLTEDERILQALDPASGNVVWSLRLPYLKSSFYSHHVHGGRLYSASVVVDLAKKAIVHVFPDEPIVNAMAFGEHGEILTGDEHGVVRIYNHAFKRLRRIRTGGKEIVELETAGRDVLVSTEERRSGLYHAAFAVVTQQGKKRWQLGWPPDNLPGAALFAVADRDVVLMEPDLTWAKLWLTSRKLSTGQLNWKTDPGLGGQPALCGNRVYLTDGERVRRFDLRSGPETTAPK